MRIVAICRSGGDYTYEHVEALWSQCKKFAPDVPFVCLADVPVECNWIPFEHDWPGWWAKMEMFRLPGPCLYFDLDTVLIADLGPLLKQAQAAPFTIMRDVYRPAHLQSSVLAWSGDMHWLYDAFAADPQTHMADPSLSHPSDQGFIESRVTAPTIWQDAVPGALASWKVHCRGRGIPGGTRVLVFHGYPRPWQVENPAWL